MMGPGEADQHPHRQRGEEGVADMIGEPDRQESEDKGLIRPQPEVLVQQRDDDDHQSEQPVHSIWCYSSSVSTAATSTSNPFSTSERATSPRPHFPRRW